MRGPFFRRRPVETTAAPASAGGAGASACGLLTCPHCGLRLETLALRCPRCRTDIPLGCGGDCSTCGRVVGRTAATELTEARADEYARGT